MKIRTAYGEKLIVRRIGKQGEYLYEPANKSAPNGGWWLLNAQRGYVPVPSNSPALVLAKKEAGLLL
jgi:hypothetical protein